MDALGVSYEAVSPGVDELLPAETKVQDAVAMLAERKARAVADRYPEAVVIGADQLVAFRGQALGKPVNRAAAMTQLTALSGNEHEIVTGVCVLAPSFFAREVETTRMELYPLTQAEVEAYLDTREWEGCAGGYRVESRGQALFRRIDGDRTNVQGLPMLRVVRLLRAAGVKLF